MAWWVRAKYVQGAVLLVLLGALLYQNSRLYEATRKAAVSKKHADRLHKQLGECNQKLTDLKRRQPEGGEREVKHTKPRKTPPPAPSTPSQRFEVVIHVFTYNRLRGLQRLWESLVGAKYMGHRVALSLFFDKDKGGDTHAQSETADWVSKARWPHGPFRIHRREVNVGLKRSIMEAWYPTSMDNATFGVFFEDDIEVSPLWYEWTVSALTSYGGEGRDPKLLGISLYRPIHDELTGKGMVIDTGGKPFLFQQPCSWGAVYFPEPWRAFREWYNGVSSHDVITKGHGIPRLSSNTWDHKSSWKKYLIKYMVDQGLYMVYPNTPDRTVLATNHLMKGEHPTPRRDLFELPLLTTEMQKDALDNGGNLLEAPPIAELQVYDVAFRKVDSVDALPGN